MTIAEKQAIKAKKKYTKLYNSYYKKALKVAHKQIKHAVNEGKEVTTICYCLGLKINTDIFVDVLEAVKERLTNEGYYIRKHTLGDLCLDIRISWGDEIENQKKIDSFHELNKDAVKNEK